MQKPNIRQIQPSDNADVAKLIRTVMPEFGCDGPGYAIHDAEVDQMFEAYNNESSVYFVLESQGHILGGAGIAPLLNGAPDTCELKKMYFMPELRGQGLGQILLKRCLDEAKSRGFKKCYLETVARMVQARKLYERMGFNKLTGALGGTGHSSCDMWYLRELWKV